MSTEPTQRQIIDAHAMIRKATPDAGISAPLRVAAALLAERDAALSRAERAESLIKEGWMRANVITGKGERTPEGMVSDLVHLYQREDERAQRAERERDDLIKVVAGVESDKDSVLAMLTRAATHDGNGPVPLHRSHVLNTLARVERFKKERDEALAALKQITDRLDATHDRLTRNSAGGGLEHERGAGGGKEQ